MPLTFYKYRIWGLVKKIWVQESCISTVWKEKLSPRKGSFLDLKLKLKHWILVLSFVGFRKVFWFSLCMLCTCRQKRSCLPVSRWEAGGGFFFFFSFSLLQWMKLCQELSKKLENKIVLYSSLLLHFGSYLYKMILSKPSVSAESILGLFCMVGCFIVTYS